MNRRTFLQTGATALALPSIGSSADQPWGGPVLDVHLHPRRGGGSAVEHLEGSGCTKALLLTQLQLADKARLEVSNNPGRFTWFVSTDPSQPGAIDKLRSAIESGARGIGEMKHHLAADSPEMQKVYDFAAEMNVPVTIHFQEVEHFAGEGDFNSGYRHFDRMLKAHRKTTFIGHADFFWANISADVPAKVAYPTGPVKPGGLTDKWLSDHPNLYADMSANSGFNALSRDPDFTRGFISRHQGKLLFGCDCSCTDGHGTGGSPILPQLKGKCVARSILEVAQNSTSPQLFRRITWENGTRLLNISA